MPKYWYDKASNKTTEEISEKEREFNISILADKKPLFMRYIYPNIMKLYKEYVNNTDKKCIREFRVSIDTLLHKKDLTNEEDSFLSYYHSRMPVGTNDCVMNKVCIKFENVFDRYVQKSMASTVFDFSILKSGEEYNMSHFYSISKIYKEYNKRLKEYSYQIKTERIDEDISSSKLEIMIDSFKKECLLICSNESQLCDIIVDLCYSKETSKEFCWTICSEQIIKNLLNKNNMKIKYLKKDAIGDVYFKGMKFSLVEEELK